MTTSFYTEEELKNIGLKKFGKNVLISKKASIYSPENISIGNNVRIDDFCILSGNINIGSYIHIAAFSALYGGKDGIFIDDFANISSRVCVYSLSDDYSGQSMTNPMIPDCYKKVYSAPVVINKHVIIGSTCVILPGVTLAKGVAIGCMSLVNKSIDNIGIYAGIPCKFIKPREDKFYLLEKEFSNECLNQKK